MAPPGYSRLVTWVTVCGVVIYRTLGNKITPLAIRTPGKKHKGRPILVILEVPLKKEEARMYPLLSGCLSPPLSLGILAWVYYKLLHLTTIW